MALAAVTLVGACSAPARKFDHTASALGLRREVISGRGFQHVLYWQEGDANRTLHVYLGGDGTPEKAGRPAKDPTPRNPLMLRLLSLDPGPAVYLGRPCYHGMAETAGCSSALWTTGRYSEDLVASLATSISGIMAAGGYDRISLFGHSGGGTLAMLLAARLPETTAVVTIAANMDTDAWTDHHRHAPLTNSLNPARQPPLPDRIIQHHYAGGRDRVVPSALTAQGTRASKGQIIVIDAYDHVCCWSELWPKILADVAAVGD